MEKLYDITEVCKLISVTSRTLRFWEEKGIVESLQKPFSTRRQYTGEQVEGIKKVAFLRSLGISIPKILEWQRSGADIRAIIDERRSEVLSLINRKTREYEKLTGAFMTLSDGGDIFGSVENSVLPADEMLSIAKKCTDAFLSDELSVCMEFFSEKMRSYMPLPVFEKVRQDVLSHIGAYTGECSFEGDKNNPNIVYANLNFEKMELCVKYVFGKSCIHGLWFNYYGADSSLMVDQSCVY